MIEPKDIEKLRILSDDYYQQRISKEEYRSLRTELIQKIDNELNNTEAEQGVEEAGSGFVNKFISFFKDPDEEKIL